MHFKWKNLKFNFTSFVTKVTLSFLLGLFLPILKFNGLIQSSGTTEKLALDYPYAGIITTRLKRILRFKRPIVKKKKADKDITRKKLNIHQVFFR